ncbi:MAG: DUF1501 domain-containing protein [Verrucomicrobiota bacterium]
MNRREFIGSANCAALSSVGIFNTLVNLKMMGNAVAAPLPGAGDYRALVCLFLHGGNDSYNMLLPTTADEYTNYAAIRSNLALAAPDPMNPQAILPLAGTTGGRTFGLHHSLPEMQGLYNSGKLAFLANVGTLVEPTTVTDYKNGAVTLPRSLFSHNDQQREWQTSVPQGNLKTGWGGRMADRIMSVNPSNSISMNISLAGTNLLQTGDSAFAYSIDKNGAKVLTGSESSDANVLNRVDGAKSLVEKEYRDVLRRAYADEASRGYDSAEAFTTAFDSATVSTSFPSHSVAQNLRAVAKTIAARGTLGHNRQIFFVEYGGFDNHAELPIAHAGLMANLDADLKAFWDSLIELGVEDEVTLFSCSDFGRTLRSNGQGTDHAWGGNSFMMGGCVDGGKIFGSYPDDSEMGIGTGLDVGFNGRLLPSTSCDEYFAELALWFGLSPSDLVDVFPNLGNFYSYSAATPPVGFLL